MKTPFLALSFAAAALAVAPLTLAHAQTGLVKRGQAAAPAAPAMASLTGAARADALTRASAALNQVRNIQGRFAQTAPDGARTTGLFYLSRGQGNRMGRLRFEYDAPTQFLVVADGVNVATIDRALRSTTAVGIGETPLQYLLKPNINLDRDTRVVDVVQGSGELAITVRDRTNKVEGALKLFLDASTMALKAWEVTDAARNVTRLTLTESRAVASISPRLFQIERFNTPRRR